MQPEERAEPQPLGPAFRALELLVVNATGHVRLATRNGLLMEKLQRRLRSNGLTSLESYLDLVTHAEGANEFDLLIAELTIGETSFFRHPEHFELLRDVVLPEVMARNAASRQIRIWSAGCASGPEAYSIAILMHSLLGERAQDWAVSIVGSDISRAALADAEAGVFSDWMLREMEEPRRRGFFTRTDAGWAIREKYKKGVRFVHHNLISGAFPSVHENIFGFDLILCRNVMIYFDEQTNARLADRLDTVLADGGWLFVAPADFSPRLQRIFQAESHPGGVVVYRKQSAAMRAARTRPVGAALFGSHMPEQAATIADAPAAVAPPRGEHRPAPEARLEIGAIIDAANRGDWADATRLCDALLKRDSCNARARYYRALILLNAGAVREGERELRRAVYLDRDFALAYYQLGLTRKDAHDRRGAARAFRNVIDILDPVPDGQPIGAGEDVSAAELRLLAVQQLERMGRS